MSRRASGRLGKADGFTLVEMIIYMIISSVVVASVFQLLISQMRSYTAQRELMDAHSTLRSAASLLTWELRQASAARGDIYTIDQDAIVLRSVQATGVVCDKHGSQPRYGLSRLAGDLDDTADDSAMVFRTGGADGWNIVKIQTVATAGTLGVGNCDWAGTPAPDIAVEVVVANVPADTLGVMVGAVFQSFRRVEYALYEQYGRWWFGRKVGAAASYEMLTGPLLGTTGIQFVYLDAAGNVAGDPADVASITLVLRAESYVELSTGFQRDTLAIKVALRS